MAFNFGAFAGGLAKGGMDTYSTLTDIEAKQQETKRREAEFGAWQKEQAGKEALRTAIAEQGGEKTFTPNFSGTGGMDSNDVAPTPVTQTPSQRLGGAMERAVQMGADPMAVMQYKQAARQDISADAAQKAFDWMQASDKAVAEKGLVKAAEEYLIPHYNSNKGLMNDGMTAKVVNTKVGPIVQFSDAQGNIQHNMTQPLTIKTFGQARDLVGSSMLMASGPEHFYKGQELGLKRETLDIEREFKGKGGVYERIHDKANAAAEARTNKPTVQGVNIDMGTDANGKALGKQRVTVVTKLDKEGVPTVTAYDLGGKKITDPKLMGQVSSAFSAEGVVPVDSRFATMRKAVLENKDMPYADKKKELEAIDLEEKLAPITTGKVGGMLNPNATGEVPKALPSARAIAYTKGGFDKWADAASSGSAADKALGREILQGWVDNNELTAGERKRALQLLK